MLSSIISLTDLNLPALQPYRTLKRQEDHRREGTFVAEGDKVVRRFLHSNLTCLTVLLAHSRLDEFRPLLEKKGDPIELFLADDRLLQEIVGYHLHQGVMAVGQTPVSPELAGAIDGSSSPRLFVAVDNVVGAENMGVIVRNCAACGVHALVVGPTSADPYLRRSVRNSMGTIFGLPIVYSDDLGKSVDMMRLSGIRVFAAHPRPGSKPVFEVDMRGDCCIVFGNEGDGVSGAVVDKCFMAIELPMAPGVDSCNVACASSAILFEAVRQRRWNDGMME